MKGAMGLLHVGPCDGTLSYLISFPPTGRLARADWRSPGWMLEQLPSCLIHLSVTALLTLCYHNISLHLVSTECRAQKHWIGIVEVSPTSAKENKNTINSMQSGTQSWALGHLDMLTARRADKLARRETVQRF